MTPCWLINSQKWFGTQMLKALNLKSFDLNKTSKQTHMRLHVSSIHDDVIKWKRFRVTGHLCGEFTGPGEIPAQRPVTRSFDVSLIWINGWVNNGEAGNLRRHRAHYDGTVMQYVCRWSGWVRWGKTPRGVNHPPRFSRIWRNEYNFW